MTGPRPRSFVELGFAWAQRVLAMGLELALPTLGGYALDRWWGTSPLVTLLGGGFGFTALLIHLFRINREGTGS